MLNTEQIKKLNEPLPEWALKSHPTKSNMTVIHPMAVIDRLNEVFGVGEWHFKTDYISCNPFIQKTRNGERSMYMSAVKGTLTVPKHEIHIEQYGGSSNDDMGDALKGGATDALTKISSYLGVGASIYKGQGNNPATNATPTSIPQARFKELAEKYEKEKVAPPIEEWEKMSYEQKKIINDIKLKVRK
jgi:hypothetical protein